MTTPPAVRTPVDTSLSLALQLVAALYAAPRDAFFADLEAGSIDDVANVLADHVGLAPLAPLPRDRTTVQAAHADLFVSSAHAPITPPYVGYAQDDDLLGPTAEAVGRYLASAGIGIDPAWRDLPDHLSAVAESASLLVLAGRHNDAAHVAGTWLLPWFDRYAAEVAAKDASGLYGPLTTLLHAAIQEVSRGDRP